MINKRFEIKNMVFFIFYLFVFQLLALNTFAFNSNNTQTSYSEDGYNTDAIQPVNLNWSHQSNYNLKDFPYEKGVYKIGSGNESLVIGNDGTIYYVDNDMYSKTVSVSLCAVNPNGTEKWRYTIPYIGQNFNQGDPVIGVDGTIYFCIGGNTRTTPNNSAGSLIAISPNGTLKWQFQRNNEFTDFSGEPLIDSNGGIYVTVCHTRLDKAQIIAVSSDGKTERVISEINSYDPNYYTQLSFSKDDTLYVNYQTYNSSSNDIYRNFIAMNKMGKIKWNIKHNTEGIVSYILGSNSIYTKFSSKDSTNNYPMGYVSAYDFNGKQKWISSKKLNRPGTPIISKNGVIYISSVGEISREGGNKPTNCYIDAYDSDNGNLIWSTTIDGFTISDITLSDDGTLYGTTSFYDKSDPKYWKVKGNFFAIETSGALRWTNAINYSARLNTLYITPDNTLYTVVNNNNGFSQYLYQLGTKNISIEINEKELVTDTSPKLVNDRVMVPIRVLCESFGATVNWDEFSGTITIKKENTIITMLPGSKNVKINGKIKKLDIPTFEYNGRTYIQTRFIAETFGASVSWDEENKLVKITR